MTQYDISFEYGLLQSYTALLWQKEASDKPFKSELLVYLECTLQFGFSFVKDGQYIQSTLTKSKMHKSNNIYL